MSEQREMLVSMMARDRERYRLEDRELEIKMAEQGIRCVIWSGLIVDQPIISVMIPG